MAEPARETVPNAAHTTLRDAVLGRLALLDQAAGQADPSALLALARNEINRLAMGWRRLLSAHRCGEEGRCLGCPPATRTRWPCQVWRTAHEQIIGEGASHKRRTYPLRNPLGRLARTMAARRAEEARLAADAAGQ